MSQEHIDRFHRYCGTGGTDNDMGEYVLSGDRCMGIKKEINENNLVFFGTLKLKYRTKAKYVQIGNVYVNTKYLFKAMKVLHRRKYLSLGLVKMDHGFIIIVKEGDRNVCVAPAMPDESYSDATDSILNMVEPASGLLIEWLCFSGVFGDRKG